jgi:hypothetical protein
MLHAACWCNCVEGHVVWRGHMGVLVDTASFNSSSGSGCRHVGCWGSQVEQDAPHAHAGAPHAQPVHAACCCHLPAGPTWCQDGDEVVHDLGVHLEARLVERVRHHVQDLPDQPLVVLLWGEQGRGAGVSKGLGLGVVRLVGCFSKCVRHAPAMIVYCTVLHRMDWPTPGHANSGRTSTHSAGAAAAQLPGLCPHLVEGGAEAALCKLAQQVLQQLQPGLRHVALRVPGGRGSKTERVSAAGHTRDHRAADRQ